MTPGAIRTNMTAETVVTNRLAGDIGLCISAALWLITLWRVGFHLLRCCKEQNENSSSTSCEKSMTRRRVFHALLWMAMSLECVAYADVAGIFPLSHDRAYATKLGYVLLEVIGRAFEFLAFSIVTMLWFDTARATTAEERTLLDSLPRILLALGLILSMASVWEAFDILISSKDASWVFRLHIFVESVSWGLHAIAAAICTWMTATRILRLSTLPQSGIWTRRAVFSKALAPMILCSMCYAARAVWLLCLFVQMPKTSNLANRYGVAWWIGFVWIPTLVPSTTLLYSARKRDPPPDQDNDRLTHPLLPTPGPPAEAFISFKRFRENHDLFSPLSVDPRAEGSDLFQPAEDECRALDYKEGTTD
jgi:hypothetical protein